MRAHSSDSGDGSAGNRWRAYRGLRFRLLSPEPAAPLPQAGLNHRSDKQCFAFEPMLIRTSQENRLSRLLTDNSIQQTNEPRSMPLIGNPCIGPTRQHYQLYGTVQFLAYL